MTRSIRYLCSYAHVCHGVLVCVCVWCVCWGVHTCCAYAFRVEADDEEGPHLSILTPSVMKTLIPLRFISTHFTQTWLRELGRNKKIRRRTE